MLSELNTSVVPPNASAYIIPADDVPFYVEPPPLKIFRFVVYAIIILFALVGNVAVCIISRRSRRLQTSTYCLIMNLAVSDIGSVLCLPFLLPELFIGNWLMGDAMCKLLKPSVVIFNFVTTNTLVAIACDRFRAVVFPFATRPSKSETRFIVALLWLIAFLFSLPSYGAMRVVTYSDVYYCMDIFSDDVEKDTLYRRIYTITMYIVQALLPVLVISALYLKITATLKHIRLVPLALKSTRSSSLNSTPNASPHSSTLNLNKLTMNPAGALRRQMMEKKFLRMLMTVLLVYVLCYLPFQTMYLIYEFNPDLGYLPYMQPLSEYLYLIVWLPNALNPVCYGCLNEQYKRAFKAMIFRPRKYFQTLKSRHSFSQSTAITVNKIR
ncbi:hypothetical protein OS493_008226 [Desmophyllum pertusum]|uniref:G-protein coupled receptors family 1 profile domain-containing protein n=1 Tax=Desmophyllum pertusum TaxID=174260 RepID=A0A9X0DAW8_9CNID|nr:hypothetical protein OS493_008226 [Desmophyllum pertusum]